MNRIHWLGFLLIGIVCITALWGCQPRPAVPTTAPEPTEPVVVIVVTATSQPTLAPTQTSEATITPIPTLTTEVTTTITSTLRATVRATGAAVKPTSAKATTVAQQPTASAQATEPPTSPVPSNFTAPMGFAPEDKAFRDGDAVKFEFSSVGPLAQDQCYRFDMTLGNPTGPGGVGDYWIALCGNQSNSGDRLAFNLKPGRFRDEPNYGTLLVSADSVIPPTPQYTMQWFVSVVRVLDASDPVHPKVEALSPTSAPLQNSFFR